jgi:hypothetical protein
VLNSTGAVAQIGSWVQVASGDESVSATKPRYRTTNWKRYNAALIARGSLTIWLDKGISWFAAASGKRGRSPQFSDAAIQFCLTIKNLFGLALRQTTGFVQSLLALSGLPWPVPDFSTLYRRQRIWMCRWHTGPVQPACTCWLTPQASSSWAKASGSAKSMGQSAGANGASCTSASMHNAAGAGHLRHQQRH